MTKTIELLSNEFQNSTCITPEFTDFFNIFKKEFTDELELINCINIKFFKGHFDLFGFFTYKEQAYYFSLPDIRNFRKQNNNNSWMNRLLFRTVKDYSDYVGGLNRYTEIKPNMIKDIVWYLKTINQNKQCS